MLMLSFLVFKSSLCSHRGPPVTSQPSRRQTIYRRPLLSSPEPEITRQMRNPSSDEFGEDGLHLDLTEGDDVDFGDEMKPVQLAKQTGKCSSLLATAQTQQSQVNHDRLPTKLKCFSSLISWRGQLSTWSPRFLALLRSGSGNLHINVFLYRFETDSFC